MATHIRIGCRLNHNPFQVMSCISIIVAVADNYAIGYSNKLIYWLPDDLKRFKALTSGHTIIMGRHTFESLPRGALPNRRNIVLSRSNNSFPGCDCFSSLDEALESCKNDEEVFIIGGETLYREAISKADKLYITHVYNIPKEADAFFPAINMDEWKIKNREDHQTDDRHPYNFSFINYERLSN